MTLRDLKIVNFRIYNEVAMFQNGALRTSHPKNNVAKRSNVLVGATIGRPYRSATKSYKIVINIGTKSKEVSKGENV